MPDNATHSALAYHVAKADQIEVYLCIVDGKITETGFRGEGSAVAIASASLMSEIVRGMAVSAALKLQRDMRDMLKDADSEYSPEAINPELLALHSISKFPARVACASLAWEALEKALTANGTSIQ